MTQQDELLNKIKQNPLVGEIAHQQISLINRTFLPKNKKYKRAAVLIALFQKENKWFFPLTERAVYKGKHSGEISLPGGKFEEKDGTLEQTALREVNEELGIKKEKITIIRELTPIYIPPSDFLVTPYVGFLKNVPHYFPEEKEVKSVFNVDLETMVHSNSKKEDFSKGMTFVFHNNVVWGATACILNEFSYLIEKM